MVKQQVKGKFIYAKQRLRNNMKFENVKGNVTKIQKRHSRQSKLVTEINYIHEKVMDMRTES